MYGFIVVFERKKRFFLCFGFIFSYFLFTAATEDSHHRKWRKRHHRQRSNYDSKYTNDLLDGTWVCFFPVFVQICVM